MQKEEKERMGIPATLFANLQRVFRCLSFGRSLKTKSPTLSVAQMRILSFFNEQDVVCISEISRALDMSLQSVNNLIHRLETMGHVERSKNSNDKRVSDIRLTDKGRIGFKAFRDEQLEVISEILSGIEPDEQRLLAATLETAAIILEKAAVKATNDKT
jgi:DNA-binding MarR family transcriptional regulator